ncbi:hypothetical protein ES703_66492 [subsurface metagenome]
MGVAAAVIGSILDICTGLTVPVWIWMTIALLGLIIAMFLAFHQVRLSRDRLEEQLDDKRSDTPILKKPSPVLYIEIREHRFSSSATPGFPSTKGTVIWLRLLVQFNAPKTMLIEAIELNLGGKRIPANDYKSSKLSGISLPTYFYFEIPNSVTPGEHPVQLTVLTDAGEWCSDEFRITLPQR